MGTRRKTNAEASEGQLLGIIASATDAIVAVDGDQRITLFNAAAERMFGCPAVQAVGSSSDRFIPQRFRAAHRQHIKQFARTGITARAMGHQRALAALRADGVEFPVEATISQVTVEGRTLFTAIVRDVSERHRAEQALRENEDRLRAIVDTAVDAIITIDDHGRIDSVNPAAQRLFGYSAGELVGRNIRILMPEPYAGEHDGYLARYLRTGEARIIGIGREVVGLHKDGSTFPLSLAVSEFRVAGQRMFTGILHDISNRRRLEREVLEASANEQRRIGHDLHDGLCQQILGASFGIEVLARRLEATAPQEAAAARKLLDLLNDTLSQARALAHGLNPIDLRAGGLPKALADLAAKVRDVFHRDCRFENSDRTDVADANTATHLFRIAQEAISNAIKHGNAKRIALDLTESAGVLTLTIRDDGRGFTADSLAKTDGRGLSIMQYRAGLVGGTLLVGRAKPRGTVVTCSLRSPSA